MIGSFRAARSGYRLIRYRLLVIRLRIYFL